MASISAKTFVVIHAVEGTMGTIWVELAPEKEKMEWFAKYLVWRITKKDAFRGKFRLVINGSKNGDGLYGVDFRHATSRKFTFAMYLAWVGSGEKPQKVNG